MTDRLLPTIERHLNRFGCNNNNKGLKYLLILANCVVLSLIVTHTSMQDATDNITKSRFMTSFDYNNNNNINEGSQKLQEFEFPPEVLQEVEEFKRNQQQQTYKSTIVSAYFELPQGHGKRDNSFYLDYMRNFLCINDPVIVFTQPQYVKQMKQLRAHAPDRTLIVPMDFEDIEIGNHVHWSDEHWQDQCRLKIDPACHEGNERNGNLYKIWLGKTWIVNQAVRLNPFGSDVFSWMDIGLMREGEYFCGDTVMRHPEIVPEDDRILLFMWRKLDELEDHMRYENPIFSEGFKSFYVTGGCIGGNAEAWRRFLDKMEETMVLFDEKGVGLSEDQSVMQSTCMRNEGLCAICRTDNDFGVGDGQGGCNEGTHARFQMCLDRPGWKTGSMNGFFSTKFRYYHGVGGGPLKVFDPALGLPTREQAPDLYWPLTEKK